MSGGEGNGSFRYQMNGEEGEGEGEEGEGEGEGEGEEPPLACFNTDKLAGQARADLIPLAIAIACLMVGQAVRGPARLTLIENRGPGTWVPGPLFVYAVKVHSFYARIARWTTNKEIQRCVT